MHTRMFRGMKHRRMGRSGLWVSEIGLGLWKWGDPSYDGSRVGEHDGFAILDHALDLGVTHWDTANSYNKGAGNSERLLGRYFASRGSSARRQVVLATKISNPVRDEHQLQRDFSPNESGASRRYILSAVEDCLSRLETDFIDVLYHHSPKLEPGGQWEAPLDETWDAFNLLVSQGKVRYLAVSQRTTTQLQEESAALSSVANNSARRIVAVQNAFNMLQRPLVSALGESATTQDEQHFLEYVHQQQIGLVPFIPLAVGMLTGRYRKNKTDPQGRLNAADEAWRDRCLNERNLELVEQLIAVANDKNCTLPQLAIAWLLSHDTIPSVIAGVTKLSQLQDNVKAQSVSLTIEERNILDAMTSA